MDKYEPKFASMVIDTREESAKVVIDGHEINPATVAHDFKVTTGSDMAGAAHVTLTFYVDELDVTLVGPNGQPRRMTLQEGEFAPAVPNP